MTNEILALLPDPAEYGRISAKLRFAACDDSSGMWFLYEEKPKLNKMFGNWHAQGGSDSAVCAPPQLRGCRSKDVFEYKEGKWLRCE